MKKRRESIIKEDVVNYVHVTLGFFLLLLALFIIRILWIQFVSSEVDINTKKMHRRIFHTEKIEAHRGTIFANNGDPLAISIQRYHVEMDFGSEGFDSLRTFRAQSDSLAKLLSAYFKDRTEGQYRDLFRTSRDQHYQLTYRKDTLVRRSEGWIDHLINSIKGKPMKIVKLYDTIRNHRPVKILPRDVDYSEWQVLRKFPILNWNMGMTYRLVGADDRVYTHNDLALRTLGRINDDRGNDFGIEAVYNNFLKGEDGEEERQRIARGFYGRVAGGVRRDAIDGMDVMTTINAEIQGVAHQSLIEQLELQRALWGTAIVMEVETGNILAMVNLDRLSDGSYAEQRNHAIGARCEPGSTFKLAATMALLEEAQMPSSTIYDSKDGRRVKIGRTTVQDSHKGYSEVDLRTAFSQSLNVYYAKAIFEHFGAEPMRYVEFLQNNLKLDQTVGFEPFGELKPGLRKPGDKNWDRDMTVVNMGYGYAIELSPIQTLTYFNGVANGGNIVAPRLVTEVSKDGHVIKRFPVRSIARNICSDRTLDTLRSYMEEVCTSGTAMHFLGKFDGFKAAAKSGTAQYAQGGIRHGDGYYLGSLVGYMPADKPKYTIMTAVMVRRGQSRTIYGAGLAGPTVRDVMQYLYNQELEWHTQIESSPKGHHPTSIKGGEAKSVERIVRELMPERERVKNGAVWSRAVVDSLSRVEYLNIELDKGVMPNLYGMALKEAIFILEEMGIRVNFSGSGKVFRQSVRAGQPIKEGATVTLTLR